MEKVEIKNLDEFRDWVERFKLDLPTRAVILLSGALGAGKTQFVKCLVGEEKAVSSPTFTLHNQYNTQFGSVDHVDLYRLESDEDLESSGVWDLFENESGYIIVEWADRLEASILPPDWNKISIHIDLVSETKRSIQFG